MSDPNSLPPPSSVEDQAPLSRRPYLRVLKYSSDHLFTAPKKCINDPEHMDTFSHTTALADLNTFLLQLNVAMFPRLQAQQKDSRGERGVGAGQPTGSAQASLSSDQSGHWQDWPLDSDKILLPGSVQELRKIIDRLDELLDEVAPSTGPRRFGNVAFREWHRRASEEVPLLIRKFLLSTEASRWLSNGRASIQSSSVSQEQNDEENAQASAESVVEPVVEELTAYLIGALGSSQRLDFGTGHELSFLAFLACLWRLGAFDQDVSIGQSEITDPNDPDYDSAPDDSDDQNLERAIVIGVIEPYLKLIRRTILRYTLEPAGSHGAWGLDDHSFVPYILGSAQFCHPIRSVDEITTRGSLSSAPSTEEVVKPKSIELYRSKNMYFSAIGFIYDVKRGNFWEHSPLLYDISRLPGGWCRTNNGMLAMFADHVLSKFPVVQHFPFGSILRWERSGRPKRRPLATVVRDHSEEAVPPKPVPMSYPPLPPVMSHSRTLRPNIPLPGGFSGASSRGVHPARAPVGSFIPSRNPGSSTGNSMKMTNTISSLAPSSRFPDPSSSHRPSMTSLSPGGEHIATQFPITQRPAAPPTSSGSATSCPGATDPASESHREPSLREDGGEVGERLSK